MTPSELAEPAPQEKVLMIYRYVELLCDWCEEEASPTEPTVRKARKTAFHLGWLQVDGKDICSDCIVKHRNDLVLTTDSV